MTIERIIFDLLIGAIIGLSFWAGVFFMDWLWRKDGEHN
jgi:hypothetical protein